MLRKLKILIYENYLSFLFSILCFLFFIKKIPFLLFLTGFLGGWNIWGSLGQAFFWGFIFLPLFLVITHEINFPFYIIFISIFLLFFLVFKKIKYFDWLILFLSFLMNFYLLSRDYYFLLLFPVIILFWLVYFRGKNLFSALISVLFFFELIFALMFFHFSFIQKTIIIFLLFLIFHYVIIKNYESYSYSY